MALYISVSLECESCCREDTSQSSVQAAVKHWRDSGGIVDDDGHNAICEDCSGLLEG